MAKRIPIVKFNPHIKVVTLGTDRMVRTLKKAKARKATRGRKRR